MNLMKGPGGRTARAEPDVPIIKQFKKINGALKYKPEGDF